MAQELLGFTQVSHEGKLASAGTACSGPFETSPENPTANLFCFGDHLQCLALLCSQSISNCCMSDNVRLENTFVSTSQFAEIHSIFKVKQLARKLNVSVTLHLRREISL